MDRPVTRSDVAAGLRHVGLAQGAVVLLHSSLSSVGFVVGGASTIVHALLDVLGPDGTLVVPTMTANNSDPSRWARTWQRPVPEDWWPVLREAMPAFDPWRTPSVGMGAIAEAVRTWPGAVRSAHPQTSFAAVGAEAVALTTDHAVDCHLGEESPLGRLSARGGVSIMLLGVGFEVCSAFHLGEYRWPGNGRRDYECVVDDAGRRDWLRYVDARLDDSDFARLGADLETAEVGEQVRRGRIGAAEVRTVPFDAAVEFATTWFTGNRQHPPSAMMGA